MSVKKLVIPCSCPVALCDHAKEEVGNMLQETYDDAYDEGWNDAFISVRETLVSMGFDKASKMETPPPPPRKKMRSSRGSARELVN